MVGLEDGEILRYVAPIGDEGEQRWVYTRSDYPAQDVSLRAAEGERFAVLNAADDYKMIEELDASSAPFRVHPGAVYLHQGEVLPGHRIQPRPAPRDRDAGRG